MKDLLVVMVVVGCFVSHQIHIACSEYVSGCPDVSQYDFIARMPLVKEFGGIIYKSLRISHRFLPVIASIGKGSYYVLFCTFVYCFALRFIQRVLYIAIALLCAGVIASVWLPEYEELNKLVKDIGYKKF